MSTPTADQLAVMLRQKITERGEAPSGVSLPGLRLMIVRGGETLARAALQTQETRQYLVQQFQTELLTSGKVDISNLINEPNRLLIEGAKTWTVTLDDDASSELIHSVNLGELRRAKTSDSFMRRYCIDGVVLRTRDRGGSLTAIDSVRVNISGVAVPDIPTELPDPLVEFYLDLLARRYVPDGTAEK